LQHSFAIVEILLQSGSAMCLVKNECVGDPISHATAEHVFVEIALYGKRPAKFSPVEQICSQAYRRINGGLALSLWKLS